MKKAHFILFAALMLMTLGLSACNTIEGLGEDAKAAGNAISNAASENKKY